MKYTSNVKTVYDMIKEKIMYCELMPGELVSEKELVEGLNVSRTPVREALKVLSGEGLITVIPKKGIQIAPLPVKKIREIYELRNILEPLSIQKAIKYLKRADIDYLKELNQKLCDSYKKDDLNQAFKEGMKIHLYIAKLSGNETLYNIIKSLREECYRGFVYYLKQYLDRCADEFKKNTELSLSHVHSKFIHALEVRDEEAAIQYVIDDLDTVTNLLLQL
ncbi:GntR family transcriptional regulator [Clostridiaceae bacterium 35-E11]